MPAELRTERRGATLTLTFAEPATRNRLGEQALAAGIEVISVAESDPSLRCVVLRGDGADFCAGSAPALPAGVPASEAAAADWRSTQQLGQFAEVLRAFPGPVIGAVEGLVAGSGLALLLACDLVVAAEDARLSGSQGLPATGADVVAQAVFAAALPRAVALHWRWLDGARPFLRQLQALGMIHHVCAPGTALTEARALADRIAALPDRVRATVKAHTDAALPVTLAQQLAQAQHRLSPSLLRAI